MPQKLRVLSRGNSVGERRCVEEIGKTSSTILTRGKMYFSQGKRVMRAGREKPHQQLLARKKARRAEQGVLPAVRS